MLIQTGKGERWIIRNEARGLRFGKEGEVQIISGVDFTTVELRVGRIVSAALFPVAGKPAYLLQSDLRGGDRHTEIEWAELASVPI